MTKATESVAPEYVEDASGNRNYISWFGSVEAAQAALYSLINCKNCINCSGCSGCSRCSRCSDCSGCSRCSDCSGCSRCSGCSGCSGCSDCSGCSRCSRVAFLYDKRDMRAAGADGEAEALAPLGPPPVPIIENIHSAVYSAVSQPRALDMGSWHACETTHCRAGWVVHLAGSEGYALERFFDTPLAAQMIYGASGYDINPCRFHDNGDDALADMKRLAEEEAAGS